MVYVFLATGFEEVEAIAPVDVMRRAGLEVNIVSVTGDRTVAGVHGIEVVADTLFDDNDYSDADLLFLPGGVPGAPNLGAHQGLASVIKAHHKAGKALAAICAAPMVYGQLGITRGKRATCYPGYEQYLDGADYTAALVERDGLLFTGNGPAAALELGYVLVEHFCGKDTADALRQGMMYTTL